MAATAADLQTTPDAELTEFLGFAKEQSTASESTVRKDFPCDDGSVLVAMSSEGGDVYYEIIASPTGAQ